MRRPGWPTRFWVAVAVAIVKPLSWLLVKKDWRGGDRLPREGAIIVATNHLSWLDPLLISHFLYNNGRWPVVLAKSGLFTVPVIGSMVRAMRAIPVYRGSADAVRSLRESEERVAEGACVMFYPEGTCTRDPEFWPMEGKTGAARLALETGVPVIPVAHWGAQEILPYGDKRPRLLPRKTFRVLAGSPVDLSKYEGRPIQSEVLREATADIMAAITAQLAELRGKKPPAAPFKKSSDN
ncbi:lysophospholipid acyltransferase family protein [Planomonospora venezuelensis]|uniref:1-acyl-sn-glycerol-3-phosphate acyltransferase n=1 Tax=Planomonospora venezuelensis TaxID=1999 RepID=A0A841D3X2_PLAVE|nr:lysophospholipid acyltransferase family protein [Planomonospora venezuelensis]MBB5963087.1 1-acyl-sn-glycerol-3-phosphate acyltransferase [Planomonospora venezuelensis]GIN00654.1 1-acyl-sn-glycerol-3-phosphate acyltransferase [Planomonospora venezuelensis]